MKTPLDNFKLELKTFITGEGKEKITHLYAILQHSSLPIQFARKYEGVTGLFSFEKEQAGLINKIYKNVFTFVTHSKAKTFYDENLTGLKTTLPGGKFGYIYQPEWDNDKQAWFVLDEDNETRIYE